MQNSLWFICGLLVGLTILSITKAAVPTMKSRITDDTAIYENLSEIKVQKELKIDFDKDIHRLSQSEKQYKESLPSLSDYSRVKGSMQRINLNKKRK